MGEIPQMRCYSARVPPVRLRFQREVPAIPESAQLFMAGLIARARKLKKTIVFPEGNDPRVLQAAARLVAEGWSNRCSWGLLPRVPWKVSPRGPGPVDGLREVRRAVL